MSIRSGSGVTSSYIAPGDVELWGAPAALGTYNLRLAVTDATGAAATNILPLNVSSLANVSSVAGNNDMPNGTFGAPYSFKLRVIGGDKSRLIQYGDTFPHP